MEPIEASDIGGLGHLGDLGDLGDLGEGLGRDSKVTIFYFSPFLMRINDISIFVYKGDTFFSRHSYVIRINGEKWGLYQWGKIGIIYCG